MSTSTTDTPQASVKTTASRRVTVASVTVTAAVLSGAAFLGLLGGLSLQMAKGADPALGPKAAAARAVAPERTRRVVRRVVILSTPARPTVNASVPVAAPSAGPPPSSAVATRPVPAPAPAPVVTRTS